MKRCAKCGEVKALDQFRQRLRESGNTHPDSYCRPCRYLIHREYVARHPEKAKAVARRAARNWRAANREYVAASKRSWQEANRETVRAANRRWYRANRDKARSYVNGYRARKAQAPGRATAAAIAARVAFYGGQCYLCGAEHEGIDHVKPLAAGGSNWPANLRPICGACNSAKRDVWPFDHPAISRAASA